MNHPLFGATLSPWSFNSPTRFCRSSLFRVLSTVAMTLLLLSNLFTSTFTQAAAPNGPVWAWGDNGYGELGNGTNTKSYTPALASLPAGVTATAIAAGTYHSLAIGNNGKLYAWGLNASGQFGNGTTINSNIPLVVALPNGITPKAIAAGTFHSLAIGSDNRLYAWGDNRNGKLGTGNNTSSTTPVLVALPAGVTATAITSSFDHSLAIGSDNKLYAWGYNGNGQLGNGTYIDSNTPVVVALPAGVAPKAITTGAFGSLAIGSDNKVYGWGANSNGELGTGTTSSTATPVVAAVLPTGVTATAIAAGLYHGLAIGSDNKLYAWGKNGSGQLGTGNNISSITPVVVALPNGVTPKVIAAGGFHNLAIGSDNKLYAWGENGNEQLGNGTNTSSNIPLLTAVPSGLIPTAISAGVLHSLTILETPPVKQNQTITFNVPTFNYFPYPSGNNTFQVGATASSGLPVSFSASGACSVNGTTVAVTGVGACVITASQVGNTNYAPATPVSRTFNIVPNPTAYAILSLGTANLTSTQTQGPVAALGNSSFLGTNIAYGFNGPNAITVQGNVSFGNWGNQVNGNVVYSGSLLDKYVTFRRGGFVQNQNALPASLKDYALKVSAAWATLQTNGTVDYKPWGQIILTGNNQTQNVFNIDGAKLATANSVTIQTPANVPVIINVSGASDKLQNLGINLVGPGGGCIVFNFYQATSLNISSVGVQGTVWAPKAAVSFSSASIQGSLIAGSLSDSSGGYQSAPFEGTLPAVQ